MDKKSAKQERLKKDGALHPSPERVKSELLNQSDFFDAEDLVQMKYEMLRSANVDQVSVSDAARAFGLSRVAFYRAQRHYQNEGLAGLLPQKRGPKRAHKLTPAVMAFVHEQLQDQATGVNWPALSKQIEQEFGTAIHPRSVERAVNQARKGGRL